MINQERSLKITFELSWMIAEEAVDGFGIPERDRAYWVDKTIEESRHTVQVKATEQRSKIQEMDRKGYRVCKILAF